MKKFYLILVSFIFIITSAVGQSVVVSGANSGNGPHATLFAAFGQINASDQTGASIIIEIAGNTTEPATGSASVTIGAGNWNSIVIRPTGGAARTIQGAATAGFPLIDFNGADNVTIDGLNSGGNSLTISNTTTGTTNNTSTIRFINDASNNTISRCTILGSSTAAIGATATTHVTGNIVFSTGTTTGNDNNTISNNTIGPVGSNLPSKGIYSLGSTASTAIGNSDITIHNNNFENIFAGGVASACIYTAGGSNTWSITNNRFYQTADRTFTAGVQHSAIWVTPSTATQGAQGFTITGNIIGYRTNSATGVYTLLGGAVASKFVGIHFTGITGGNNTDISNNIVASVSLTNSTASGTATATPPFMGIYISNGVATTNGNTIGSLSANTPSLVFSTNTASSVDVYGIFNSSSNTWTANNNRVGSISFTNPNTGDPTLFAIRNSTSASQLFTCQNNLVGGTVANSIECISTDAGVNTGGIYNSAGIGLITGNIIRNITTNGGTSTTATSASVAGIITTGAAAHNVSSNDISQLTSSGASATVIGIVLSTGTGATISNNTVDTLSGSGTTAPVVSGIVISGGVSIEVFRNKIHNLFQSGAVTNTAVNGIVISAGTTVTVYNNLIGDLKAPVANGTDVIRGISITSTTASTTRNIYFNSVYLNATSTGSNFGTSGIFHTSNATATTSTLDLRNNIIVNESTFKGTGLTVAFRRSSNAMNNYSSNSNRNLYYAGTASSSNLVYFDGTNSAQTINPFKGAVSPADANSARERPPFVSTNAASGDFLKISTTTPTQAEGNARPIAGITTDFANSARDAATPDIGAFEFNGEQADKTGPSISYTPWIKTTSTANRTLTVTITDPSIVDVSADFGPRLYFRRATDVNVVNDNLSSSPGWKYVKASNNSSPFTFTTDFSLLFGGTGVAPGRDNTLFYCCTG
jgi:hypothetical protein